MTINARKRTHYETPMSVMIDVQHLMLHFKHSAGLTRAIDDISFHVKSQDIFGLLGPNGAGKTSLLRILATLIKPHAGHAYIDGYDVSKDPKKIRQNMGYVGQYGGTDDNATGLECLVLQGRLHGMSRREARTRAAELADIFQFTDIAQRKTETYSGGQRRRVEIAMGMMHRPKVLFLDEPTAGLDPQSRSFLWEELHRLRQQGLTVVFTTHYMEEADSLCDNVLIIDHGRVVAEGTPLELKQQIASDVLTLKFDHHDTIEYAEKLLTHQTYIKSINRQDDKLRLYVGCGEQALSPILSVMLQANVKISALELDRPSLHEVFIRKTERSLCDTAIEE